MSRFLVVDDDVVSCECLRDILSPYGQCDVVADGQDAIEAVRAALEANNPYTLVCLDILMPNTGGHDALRGIRRMEADHGLAGADGVKVIMTTAVRDSRHCLQAFREGCESYLAKPINATELVQQMYALGVLDRNTSPKTPSPAGSAT
ncbi:MAG TPA: response regulator [Thermoguttaceae bacterium]|nr:response regulator [Thermoguttaceae bacterium]